MAESSWPSPNIRPVRWHLNDRDLEEREAPGTARVHRAPEETGICTLEWCSYGGEGADLATDQRPDDGRSLCFDSAPLPARLEILGAPAVDLDLEVDQPVAKLAVRLCDVWPDGASTRVTYALANLTHRDSHEHPSPLERGRRYRVRIAMNHIAHAFLPGHRLRLAISTNYWPQMWPSPAAVTLTLHTGTSILELPVREPRAEDASLAPFAEPEGAPPLDSEELRPGGTRRTVIADLGGGTTTVVMEKDGGGALIRGIDLAVDGVARETYRITAGDPLSAKGEITYRQSMARGAWRVRTETRTTLEMTASEFVASAELDAYEGDRRLFSTGERFRVPRDFN